MRLLLLLSIFLSCTCLAQTQPTVYILGTAQDGGYPHMGCRKKCCNDARKNTKLQRYVVALAIADPATQQWWLAEATPDISDQLHYFHQLTGGRYSYMPAGILLTHAHIGHYAGLMQLGREVLGAKEMPVYAMPKMMNYLQTNGPWSQLVSLHNISLQPLQAETNVRLNDNIAIQPVLVPHRDEYSETVGYRITAGSRCYLFIPDINKWSKWDKDIVAEVNKVDVALLDATFYDSTELPGRSMAEVPHPLVQETMQLFANTANSTRNRIYFIHLNHTNPLIRSKDLRKSINRAGYHVAEQGAGL